MNNFELQEKAQVLTDTMTPNQLARMYLESEDKMKIMKDKGEAVLSDEKTMNIKALNDFLESLPEDYCSCIGINECEAWCIVGTEIYWKDKSGIYSGVMFEGIHSKEGYSICNLDTQQGVTTTGIFDNKLCISYSEFEEKYEDEM